MERGTVVAAVVAAVLAGSATGLGLHVWQPNPLAAVSARSGSTSSTGADGPATGHGSASSASSTSDATTSASPTQTPTESSSPTKSSSPGRSSSPTKSSSPGRSTSPSSPKSGASTSDPDPDFDRSALLRTTDFTAHGWATARVTDSYARLPDPPIIPCATIAPGQVGLVEGNAGAWSSEHTTARETVAVYADAGLAKKDFGRLLNEISNCNGSDVELTSFAHTTTASGVDDIRWFNTSGPGEARGVIGVIRNTDRLALVFISSPDSNPDDTHAHGTTDIATVLSIAGQRLR